MSGLVPSSTTTTVVSTIPLPPNAAQETGGNLEILDLKFPAKTTLADGYSNVNTTIIGSVGLGYNGTTLDRIRSGITALTTTPTGYINMLGQIVYNAIPTTRTEGQYGAIQGSNKGSLMIKDEQAAASITLADAIANPTTSIYADANILFNGTTWDRARGGVVGSTSSVTGFYNNLPFGRYVATRPTLTDGYANNVLLNTRGDLATAEQFSPQYEDNTNQVAWTAEKPLAASTNAISVATAFAAASLVVKASSGKLYKIVFTNGNAAARYLQVYNTTAVPADTAVPILSIYVAATTTFVLDLTQFGEYFSTGICVANSSTGATKTIGAADSYFHCFYL